MAYRKRRQAGLAKLSDVTDEMIAAGVAAYYAVDMRVADIEFRMLMVYQAMRAARPCSGRPDDKTLTART